MQTGIAAVENRTEVLQKITNKTNMIQQSHLEVFVPKNQNQDFKERLHPPSIAALFAIAKEWKQPECLLTGEGIKKMWSLQAVEYYPA